MNKNDAFCSIFFGGLRMALDDRREELGQTARVVEELINAQETLQRGLLCSTTSGLKAPLEQPVDELFVTLLIEHMYNQHLTETVSAIQEENADREVLYSKALFAGIFSVLFHNRASYAKRIVNAINSKH